MWGLHSIAQCGGLSFCIASAVHIPLISRMRFSGSCHSFRAAKGYYDVGLRAELSIYDGHRNPTVLSTLIGAFEDQNISADPVNVNHNIARIIRCMYCPPTWHRDRDRTAFSPLHAPSSASEPVSGRSRSGSTARVPLYYLLTLIPCI